LVSTTFFVVTKASRGYRRMPIGAKNSLLHPRIVSDSSIGCLPISLLNDDWTRTIERLGGAAALATGAGDTQAFAWGRKIPTALVLLRLVLAYCLGEWGLRSTTAWATAIGLVDISNVALLYRLRRCGDWLALLVGHLLAMTAPKQCRGRLIRILDATSVPKAGCAAQRGNGQWRIHSAFDLPSERFGHFVLTDEHEAEPLDRIPVVRGEIRLADRVHLQPDRIASVLHDGGDVVVRAGWKSARWQQQNGAAFDLLGALRNAVDGRIDQPVWIARKHAPALRMRLIAIRKSDAAAAQSRRKPAPAKAGGSPPGSKGRRPDLSADACRSRLVHPGDLAGDRRILRRRRAGAVSSAMASGTRLQTTDERDRTARSTRHR
jgi:hypothetical protein